jgi:hypothetical protein
LYLSAVTLSIAKRLPNPLQVARIGKRVRETETHMNRTRISLVGLLAGTVLAVGTPAGATAVTPGMSDTTLTTGSLTGYTEVAITGPQTYNNCTTNLNNSHKTICGQYVEAVYQNNVTKTLDFVYQFSNGWASDGVDSFSVSYFNDQNPGGWATAAYYSNTALPGFLGTPGCKYTMSGGIPECSSSGLSSTNINASVVNEAPDASTIDFNYGNGLETGFSSILIVQTYAKQYEPGGIAIQDSENFNSFALGLPGYQPVPEPGFYGVLGIGMAGILWTVKKRGKRTS